MNCLVNIDGFTSFYLALYVTKRVTEREQSIMGTIFFIFKVQIDATSHDTLQNEMQCSDPDPLGNNTVKSSLRRSRLLLGYQSLHSSLSNAV